jgi:hypothetical protein
MIVLDFSDEIISILLTSQTPTSESTLEGISTYWQCLRNTAAPLDQVINTVLGQ